MRCGWRLFLIENKYLSIFANKNSVTTDWQLAARSGIESWTSDLGAVVLATNLPASSRINFLNKLSIIIHTIIYVSMYNKMDFVIEMYSIAPGLAYLYQLNLLPQKRQNGFVGEWMFISWRCSGGCQLEPMRWSKKTQETFSGRFRENEMKTLNGSKDHYIHPAAVT